MKYLNIFFLLAAFFFLLFLSITLFFISVTVSKKTINLKEKFKAFECGFDFFSYSRMPFSMKFFLIAIIFIIFDVEISLVLPIIPTIFMSEIFKWMLTTYFFLIILAFGVMIEWKEESFEWKFY